MNNNPSPHNPHLHNPHFEAEPFFFEGKGSNGILLMHGFTSTCAEVRALGRVLNKAGFTVSGILLPGHGTEPADLNRTRWQDWAAAADKAYQELAGRCQRVFVGGESTGGLLALYLATQHPQIAGVLAYAPALNLTLRWYQKVQLQIFSPFVPGLQKGDLEGNTTWQGYRVNPLKGLIQLIKLQDEVRPNLSKITQPVLIVQSKADRTIDPLSAQMLYDQIRSPVKELHWLEKSGHCVLLDEEQHMVNRLTIDFLFKVQGMG
jgi:carboxylesterase